MRLFLERPVDKNEVRVSASYNLASVAEKAEGALLRDVVRELASKIAEDIYPEIIKNIDKDTIVRQVSLQVSDNILQELFAKPPTTKEGV